MIDVNALKDIALAIDVVFVVPAVAWIVRVERELAAIRALITRRPARGSDSTR